MKKVLFFIFPMLAVTLFSCSSNTTKKLVDDEGRIAYKKDLKFINESKVFTSVKDSKISTYYFEDNIPYVTIDGYVNSVDYYDKEVTVTDDFDYIFEDKNEYLKHIRLDIEKNCIIIYDFQFFSVDEKEYNIDPTYNKYLSMTIDEVDEDIPVIIDLDKYDINLKKFNNNIYIPFHIINAIFSCDSYYFLYYIGNSYLGYSYEDYLNIDSIKKRQNIKNDSSYTLFNYNFLRLMFNEFYGLKDYKDLDIDKMFEDEKEHLIETPKFIGTTKKMIASLNDCHTSYVGYCDLFSDSLNYYRSNREINMSNVSSTLRLNYYQEYEEAYGGITKLSDTAAMISFDSFYMSEEDGSAQKLKDYLDECGTNGYEDIIIDVSRNGGGDTFALAQVLGLLTNDDISLDFYNVRTNHYTKEVFKVDSNFDSDFTDDDAYTNFNYYVLSSGYTYSCANDFVNYCKIHNLAPILGKKSGGGGCCIAPFVTPSGAYILMSSLYGLKDSNGILCEDGIDVDYEISYDNFYNKNYLIEAINYFKS